MRDESRVSDLPEEMVERFVGDANDEGLVLKAVQSCIMSGDGTIDGVAHLVGSFSVRPPCDEQGGVRRSPVDEPHQCFRSFQLLASRCSEPVEEELSSHQVWLEVLD